MMDPNKNKSWLANRKGQVGLIIILVIAFGLIFYAAAMNIGKLSQTKTQTQIAAMAGASQLASQMTSYGQYIFQTQMGGRKRICAPSGILLALIVVVIVIIAIIITIATYGAGSGIWAVVVSAIAAIGPLAAVALAVSLVLAIANLILQVAVIQPGLTKMWNKIIQDTMGIQDQFSEQGILAGIQNVVTDTKQVPDMNDFDNDYLWGYGSDGKAVDRISRFGFYYNEKRLKDIVVPDLPGIERFMNELRDFVYKTPKKPYADPGESPDWGLYDPVDCKTNPGHECCYNAANPDPAKGKDKPIPSYCNPCCVSGKLANPLQKDEVDGDEFVSAVPSCCDCFRNGTCPAEKECGTVTTCSTFSPYGNDYPLVYDRYWENDYNNVPRKRVQVTPTEDKTILTLDGKIPMPDPSIQWSIKSFETVNCPGALPPKDLIQIKGNGPVFSFGATLYPFSNMTGRLCPKGFVNLPGSIQNEYPMYTGPCETKIKMSDVISKDFVYKCDSPEPSASDFVSFREALGTDDENKDFIKNPLDPNGTQIPVPAEKYRKFNMFDATGYYAPPDYQGPDYVPVKADSKKGIFPFFYKISNWGLDLSKLDVTADLSQHPEHCYWYDDTVSPHKCNTDSGPFYEQQPRGLLPQLHLPLDPRDPASELVYNITDHVDEKSISGKPALRPDKVSLPSDSTIPPNNPYREIIAKDNVCAQEILPLSTSGIVTDKDGFWKPGGDRFCGPPNDETKWPYYAHCAKHKPGACKEKAAFEDTNGDGVYDPKEDDDVDVPIDCYCSHENASSPEMYPDDVLDDLRYGMNDFLDVVRVLFRKWESQKIRLAVNFKFWYPDIAEWIEPRSGRGLCFICEEDRQGQLYDARDAMHEIITRLERWRDDAYWGEGCDDVWCLPKPGSCPLVQNDEWNTFYPGGIQKVINCLTHNLSNDKRFKACYDGCTNALKLANEDPAVNPYHRSDPQKYPGASAEGFRQVMQGNLCRPLPRSLILQDDGVSYFNPTKDFEDRQLNPERLHELLYCEFRDCVDDFKICNNTRCLEENRCENEYNYCVQQCDSGSQQCVGKCATCEAGCENNNLASTDPTFISRYGPGPGTIAACSPGFVTGYDSVAKTGGGCAQQADVCETKCQTNYSSFVVLTPGCLQKCQTTFNNCTKPADLCEADRQACVQVTCPIDRERCLGKTDQCGTIINTCNDICDTNSVFKPIGSPINLACHSNCNGFFTTKCGNTPADGCAIVESACQATCQSKQTTCEGNCTGSVSPACKADCQKTRKEECYPAALKHWHDCKDTPLTDPPPTNYRGACGERTGSGHKFDCQRDVHVNIDEFWTYECEYPVWDLRKDIYPLPNPVPIKTDQSQDPTDIDPLPPVPDFYTGPKGINVTKGACLDVHDPLDPTKDKKTMEYIKKSIPEATNQSAKFAVRVKFLAERLGEVNEVLAILREAEQEFTDFLNGPAKDLIQLRKDFENVETGLPYHLIYGWQGPPAESRAQFNAGEGYWHIVKVEGRTPFKCDNACGVKNGLGTKDPQWPRVKTYTKSWGTERCYELVNTDGMVKFRVTRFDEDRDPNPNTTKFPGGQKIWDFRFFHPLRGRGEIGTLRSACGPSVIPNPPGVPPSEGNIFDGAFLLNKADNNRDCWIKANELLSHGASTEVCAQYYFHMGKGKGMSHMFIKCPKNSF